MNLDAHQQDTYRRGIARCHGDQAKALRVVFCFMSESNGRQLLNDGAAFHPDPRKRRAGWADGWSAARCEPVYAALRTSLVYPDPGAAPGNNGGSTGAAQGLSDDYLTALFGRATSYGWGTIAQQLDPGTGVEFVADAFLGKLRVTDQRKYLYTKADGRPGSITCSDPAVADVLRVQQPKPSEAESDNYGAAELEQARLILASLMTDQPAPVPPQPVAFVAGLLHRSA
jgi:hypothetical protein